MGKLSWGLSLWMAFLAAGCGSGEPASKSESVPGAPASTTRNKLADIGAKDDGMVSPAAVAACGGFTIEDAASILGVQVSELEDRSEVSSSKLSLCSFLRPGSTEGVGFYLSASDSVERAVAEMEQGRGMAGFAQETIDQTTGTESQEEALESAEGIGEEAYFMEVNGTLNVRVGNVQIQVFPLEDQEQMKEVGRMVAAGLRES